MKSIQRQNKKTIHWGVLTFLMGAGLLFNANEPRVEAIELSNSHLGTFEGSTTFTTSSSTGVQPTLAIEMKNQDGSTQSYETPNGALTIPNTQEGATLKSAILKGQTLVNLYKITQSTPYTYGNGSYPMSKLSINLLANKTYLILLDFSTVDKDGKSVINFFPMSTFTDGTLKQESNFTIKQSGKFTYKYTPTKDVKEYGLVIGQNNFATNNPTVVLETAMIMEYQEGMENWDLPYFEGMQSVQMSALTITNGEPEQVEDVNGKPIPNPAFKSTAIRFEEEVILRSNGEVYDELDLMTGKLTQRLDEKNEVLANPIVRAVNMKAEPVFSVINQAEVSIVGEVKPTMVSVTVPTAPLSFVLDPNKEPDQQFIASEFSLTNDGQAPLTIELKEFVQTTTIFKDVMPDYYESWDYLTKEESKSIALGLVPQESENWLSFNPGIYYAADRQNKVIGRVKQKSTVDFEFTALHGPSFESLPNPQYRLTFVFGF